MQNQSTRWKGGEFKIILGSILFALIPVGVKWGGDNSIYVLLFGRLLIAAFVLYFFLPDKQKIVRPGWKNFFLLLVWSVMMLTGMLCYFASIQMAGMAVSAALLGAQPMLMIVLAVIFMKERITFISLLSAVLAVVGIFMVTRLDFSAPTKMELGPLLALVSALLLSFIFIYQKKFLQQFRSEELVFYQSGMQVPILAIFFFANPPELSFNLVGAWVLLGVVCTALAYNLIYAGVKTVPVQKIGILHSIEYALPVFVGVLFYHEQLTATMLAGAVLILLACVLVNLKR